MLAAGPDHATVVFSSTAPQTSSAASHPAGLAGCVVLGLAGAGVHVTRVMGIVHPQARSRPGCHQRRSPPTSGFFANASGSA